MVQNAPDNTVPESEAWALKALFEEWPGSRRSHSCEPAPGNKDGFYRALLGVIGINTVMVDNKG